MPEKLESVEAIGTTLRFQRRLLSFDWKTIGMSKFITNTSDMFGVYIVPARSWIFLKWLFQQTESVY